MIQPLGTPNPIPTQPAARPVSREAAAADPTDAVSLSAPTARARPPKGLARMALATSVAGAASGLAGAVASEADRQLLEAALPDLKRSLYSGKAEALLDLAAEPAGQTPLPERLQAMKTLAAECRAADSTEQAYRAAREGAGSRSLAQVAAEIAALVDVSDTRRGLEAFRFLEEHVTAAPPAGMDPDAARSGFLELVGSLRDPAAAGRVWSRLEGADLPEPAAERLHLVQDWSRSSRMYTADLEAGLDAIVRHHRPGETLQASLDSFQQLAGALKNPREAARAYDLLRRHTASPGPGSVSIQEKEAVIRAFLKDARSTEEAEVLFEAATATAEEGEFLDRLTVQRALLDAAASQRWSGNGVLEAWKSMLPARGPIMNEGNQRLLNLLPHTRDHGEAVEARDRLQSVRGRSYEQVEKAWLTMHRAAPDQPRRAAATTDDLLFLLRRLGPSGDLPAASQRMAGFLEATGDSEEARIALEVTERQIQPGRAAAFERLLAAGGRARAARDGALLATTPEAEGFLADLVTRHRDQRHDDGDGVTASVRLAAALLALPQQGSGALSTAKTALDRLPRLDDWKSGEDGNFQRYLQRTILPGASDLPEAAARLEDLATLASTLGKEPAELDAAWNHLANLPPAERRLRARALEAMRAVDKHALDKDLEDLDYLVRSQRPGDDLVQQADAFRRLADDSNRGRFVYERTRDWLEETGDPSPTRLRRYAEVASRHGDTTLERVMEQVEVPVGSETLAEREAILWSMSPSPEELDEALGDYRHISSGLNPIVTLDEAARAFGQIRLGVAGDHAKARKVYDRLHARLQDHPDQRLEDLANWFLAHMTLQQDPFALLDRLDEHPEELKIERRDKEVDIGGVTLPVGRRA